MIATSSSAGIATRTTRRQRVGRVAVQGALGGGTGPGAYEGAFSQPARRNAAVSPAPPAPAPAAESALEEAGALPPPVLKGGGPHGGQEPRPGRVSLKALAGRAPAGFPYRLGPLPLDL